MATKLYPIGMQTFSEIREEDFLYVDKTEYIYRMTHTSGKYFFLSRPRRFGKVSFGFDFCRVTSRERRNSLRDLLLKNWRRSGRNILCFTLAWLVVSTWRKTNLCVISCTY